LSAALAGTADAEFAGVAIGIDPTDLRRGGILAGARVAHETTLAIGVDAALGDALALIVDATLVGAAVTVESTFTRRADAKAKLADFIA
jgi:hypothetical protein